MSRASEKVNEVRASLINDIKEFAASISRAVNAETDENDIYIDHSDLKWNPQVNVAVDNSYLDVEEDTYEKRGVVSICVCNGNVIVNTYEGDEIYSKDLSVEELQGISDCLEESYISLTKN